MSTSSMLAERETGDYPLFSRLDRNFAILSLITGALALASAIVLVYERMQVYIDPNHQSICDINAILNCGTVMRTPYAEAFGFPNPFIGLVGYTIVLTISMALLAKARFANWFWICMNIGHLLAFAFVCYLWFNTTFNINALCIFCMVVWLMQTFLLVRVTARNITAGVIPAPEHIREAAQGWSWFVIVLIVVVIYGIIVIRFFDQIVGMF